MALNTRLEMNILSLKMIHTCQWTAHGARKRRYRAPYTLQPRIILPSTLQPCESLPVLQLCRVQVLDLFEYTPDIFARCKRVLCVHPRCIVLSNGGWVGARLVLSLVVKRLCNWFRGFSLITGSSLTSSFWFPPRALLPPGLRDGPKGRLPD
jgi:hypothetical protein